MLIKFEMVNGALAYFRAEDVFGILPEAADRNGSPLVGVATLLVRGIAPMGVKGTVDEIARLVNGETVREHQGVVARLLR